MLNVEAILFFGERLPELLFAHEVVQNHFASQRVLQMHYALSGVRVKAGELLLLLPRTYPGCSPFTNVTVIDISGVHITGNVTRRIYCSSMRKGAKAS